MSNWETIAKQVVDVVNALSPLANAAFPGAGAALSIGTKIVQGVIDEVPAAVQLYDQIVNGHQVTPAELKQFEADYEAAYQKTRDDIRKKLDALPAG